MSRRSPFCRHVVRTALTVVAAGALLTSLAPAANAAPGDGFVTGTVTGVDGRPLQGVEVTAAFYPVFVVPIEIVEGRAVSNADGRYRIRVPRTDDPLRVQATPARAVGGSSPTGYADQCYTGGYDCQGGADREFTALAGRTVSGIDVRLPRAAEIRGRVVDSAGRSVSGLPVLLKADGSCWPYDDERPRGSTTTDANGNYVFLRQPAYPVTACLGAGRPGAGRPYGGGYVDRPVDLTTTAGRVATPVTTVRETGAISGRVVDTDGAPVQGATVQAIVAVDAPTVTTASDGSFRIGRLPLGTLNWCVEAASYDGTCDDSPSPTVVVRSGATTNVGTVVLRRLT